jgi:hypothetical protein
MSNTAVTGILDIEKEETGDYKRENCITYEVPCTKYLEARSKKLEARLEFPLWDYLVLDT